MVHREGTAILEVDGGCLIGMEAEMDEDTV
jgi:hypothetical protein